MMPTFHTKHVEVQAWCVPDVPAELKPSTVPAWLIEEVLEGVVAFRMAKKSWSIAIAAQQLVGDNGIMERQVARPGDWIVSELNEAVVDGTRQSIGILCVYRPDEFSAVYEQALVLEQKDVLAALEGRPGWSAYRVLSRDSHCKVLEIFRLARRGLDTSNSLVEGLRSELDDLKVELEDARRQSAPVAEASPAVTLGSGWAVEPGVVEDFIGWYRSQPTHIQIAMRRVADALGGL